MRAAQTIKPGKRRLRAAGVALPYLLPALVLCFYFNYYMTASGFIYSFFDYNYVNPPGRFIGLENYLIVLKSELFWRQIKQTVIIWGFSLLFGFFTPIIQAIFLNEIVGKLQKSLKFLYILPMAIPGIASVAIWRYIWNDASGLANVIVTAFGVPPQTWLHSEKLIKMTLAVPSLLGGGFGLLIYLITIEGIDKGLYEASSLDGASPLKQIFYITIPNMMYMIKLQLLLSITGSLLAFDGPYLMTNGSGGPNKAAETVVFGIYNKAYDLMQFGQAMATSMILMAFTLILILVRNLLSKKEED